MGDTKTKYLKPCLTLGTGFHRWVIGDHAAMSPIGNWMILLERIASRMRISWHNDQESNPVFVWEKLMHTAARDGYQMENGVEQKWIDAGTRAIHKIEHDAKKVAAGVIIEECSGYPHKSMRSRYPLSEYWGAVISLNFETSWFDGEATFFDEVTEHQRLSMLHSAERRRLAAYLKVNDKRVWFPNGWVDEPETLRLGLRDFGLQPSEIRIGCDLLKAFESSAFCKTSAGHPDVVWKRNEEHKATYLEPNKNALPLGEPDLQAEFPLTWVSDFIYRPLFFAGVGLTQEELGLWWLLNQRQRNYARIDSYKIPPVYVLVHQSDPRLSFWQTQPFGIKPLICAGWDHGWEMVLETAEKMND